MPDGMVDFFGEAFEVPERVNRRLLIKFAAMASRGGDSDDAAGAAILDRLLEQMVRPEDLERFEAVCDRERVSDEELMKFVAEVLAEISARPTGLPSVSSDGPVSTKPNSGGDSSLRVIARLEEQQRPDLAFAVAQAQGLTA